MKFYKINTQFAYHNHSWIDIIIIKDWGVSIPSINLCFKTNPPYKRA